MNPSQGRHVNPHHTIRLAEGDEQLRCFSLVGQELDADGSIRNPTRVDWEAGSVFVTPPGYWHAHSNTSSREARLIPIQDAGLQTYLRTLDIRFA